MLIMMSYSKEETMVGLPSRKYPVSAGMPVFLLKKEFLLYVGISLPLWSKFLNF